MTNILMCAKSLFINQPMMLEINPLMMVYGDIRVTKGPKNDLYDVFNTLPRALIADRILRMHRGLSPNMLTGDGLHLLRDIYRLFPRFLKDPTNPSLPPDILWADPPQEIDDFRLSVRSISCIFGADSICRVHHAFMSSLYRRPKRDE
uniref:protein-serine/threonine phosphatase n=1 Tax=Ascaris lumbricoides TaxID=6252 RepID=A0A0M3HXH3_ASCLU